MPRTVGRQRRRPRLLELVILKRICSDLTRRSSLRSRRSSAWCWIGRADEAEIQKYLGLTRSSIDLAGNSEGLRQMLVSVLLESEFLYRLEFGAGEADEHGRKKTVATRSRPSHFVRPWRPRSRC